MTLYSYTNDIPDGPNNPSDDQPDMKQNTNSIDSLIAEDHYSFNVNNGGFHKYVRMIGNIIPPSRPVNSGSIYPKQVTRGAATYTAAFFVPDASTDQYQLTTTVTASYALFALNTQNYNGVGNEYYGGWTFLPGGLLYQYGTYISPGGANLSSTGTITFPVPFVTSGPINIQITPTGTSGSGQSIQASSNSQTNFTWKFTTTSSNSYSGFYWTAIGY